MEPGRGLSRVIGDAGLGAFGLFLGAVAFLLFQAATGGASDAAPEATLVFEAPPAGVGADSPEDAVRAFLDAEAAGDAGAAFGVLSEADRIANVSPQLWSSRQPLGDIRSWSWLDADALITTVDLEPGLSLTQGWSPASSSLTWSVVNERGWRISLGGTVAEPVLPDTAAAMTAARAWLSDQARCSGPDDQRLVLAAPSSAFEQLCVTGGVAVGDESSPVAGRIAADLELAYGPGASRWARSVSVEGGFALTLVAVGDRWLVIDAVVG